MSSSLKAVDELVQAKKFERSLGSQGYRSGHYKMNLHTTTEEVELGTPKQKGIPFDAAIIERYVAENLRLKKLWLKCIWQVFLYAMSKISTKPWDESKYPQVPSAIPIKRRT